MKHAIELRGGKGTIRLREDRGRIMADTEETPERGSSRHLKQMMNRPAELIMHMHGQTPQPRNEAGEHRWGRPGQHGDIDGLVRLLRRAGCFQRQQNPASAEAAREMLFSGISTEEAVRICPEWKRDIEAERGGESNGHAG